MRTLLVSAAVIGFGAVYSPFSNGGAGSAPEPAVVSVSVDLRCTGNGVSYTIEPWAARLRQGDDIEWVIHPEAHTDEVVIQPKQANAWPFGNRNFRGNRTNRPHGRGMRPNERGRRYQYNVLMVCKGPVSRPDTIVVDPEMIIE